MYCLQSPAELNEVGFCDAVGKPIKEWVAELTSCSLSPFALMTFSFNQFTNLMICAQM
jgi:hypothetical protein